MSQFSSVHGANDVIQRRNVVNTAPFETIPAWRIARLRSVLRDAEHRGADPNDGGYDLVHRALKRRFALARAHLARNDRDAAQRLVVQAWREDRFNQVVETRVLQEFGELLSGNDHKVRVSMRLDGKERQRWRQSSCDLSVLNSCIILCNLGQKSQTRVGSQADRGVLSMPQRIFL